MNIRKKLIYIFLLICAIVIIGCNNDEEVGLKTQSHDQNEIMAMLHSMLDGIDSVKLVKNPGEDFARIMIVHNKWSINMANKELKSGDDATVKDIATNMIARNEVELLEFQDFLGSHTPTESEAGSTWDNEAKVTLNIMHQDADLEVLTGDIDHDFATLLVDHHESAIEMARSYLRFGTNVNLRSLAERIITDQSAEVQSFQDWLLKSKNY